MKHNFEQTYRKFKQLEIILIIYLLIRLYIETSIKKCCLTDLSTICTQFCSDNSTFPYFVCEIKEFSNNWNYQSYFFQQQVKSILKFRNLLVSTGSSLQPQKDFPTIVKVSTQQVDCSSSWRSSKDQQGKLQPATNYLYYKYACREGMGITSVKPTL